MKSEALSHIRICDFTGQLAGAGATRWLASFGAEVIRIEDPIRGGRWDILRGAPPFKDERRGGEFGAGYQNHNIEKLGITVNMRTERGRELVEELVKVSDVVSENFAAGVLERMGLGYDHLKELKSDIIYVSNCGFGHTGPYRWFKSWGPIAQAVSGVTHQSGLPGEQPAGWGFSHLDHTGGYYMAIGILMALVHRQLTGEGQWVDMSCSEAGGSLHGADLLDWSVNGRGTRAEGRPDSNRATSPPMAPHGVYRCRGNDNWVAIAVRTDDEWRSLRGLLHDDVLDQPRFETLAGRLEAQDELDERITAWTKGRTRFEVSAELDRIGVAAGIVSRPAERVDGDINTSSWGLWPMVDHKAMGGVRVDGQPVHLSKTDWSIEEATPVLGQHNDYVFGKILGLSEDEIADLRDQKVI